MSGWKEDLHKVPWSAIMGQIGAPYIATTVAGMTDKTRVYVYQGSESGYTSGNWYYWNGSAWTSGGTYNSAAVDTDKTLTQSDKPADSAIVGKEIGSLKKDIENKMDFELWKDIVTIGGETIIQFLNIPIEEKIKDVFVVCNKLLISGSCSIIVQTRYNNFDVSNNAASVRRAVSKDDNIMIGFETFGKIRVDKSLKNNDGNFINGISAFNSKYTVSDMYKNNIIRIEIILNNSMTFLEGCELQIYIRR